MMIARRMWLPAVALAVLMLLVVACTQASSTTAPSAVETTSAIFPKNADGYADITVQPFDKLRTPQLAELLANKDFSLINVYIPYEGEIPGTDVHIPYNEIEGYADQLPQDKDAAGYLHIVLYCRSGSMSATASKTLVEMGYTNVTDVQGGMNAWKAAGYELLNRPK